MTVIGATVNLTCWGGGKYPGSDKLEIMGAEGGYRYSIRCNFTIHMAEDWLWSYQRSVCMGSCIVTEEKEEDLFLLPR